jgi:hypothetical protein
MKWIKSRKDFLNEAKIKDVILPRQAKQVKDLWSEKYLEYEEVTPTSKIKQGKWKLSKKDKLKVLSAFFGREDRPVDMESVFKTFENLDDKFVNTLKESIDIKLLEDKGKEVEKYKILLSDFNPKEPTIDQITILYESIFRKLNINETKADKYIKKDENNRPIIDEDGNMVRIEKEKGDPVFEKNLVNIKSFIESYNRCYSNQIDVDAFYSDDISNIVSLASENHNDDYKFDFEIFNRDLYLSIKHNAQDILNMAISKFFSSCQHLYTGMYRNRIIGNIFDPNSIPAFLVFDTPIFWDNDKISDFLPLSRMIIRNIESIEANESEKIYFDRAYPDRMKGIFDEIVEEYSDNIENVYDDDTYLFTPDIELDDNIDEPYMDAGYTFRQITLKRHPYIGINTKSLHLNRNHDWSNVKISPKADIKELVIETNDLPSNFFDLNLNPDWLKFKFIKINNLDVFNSVLTKSIAFEKCKLSIDVIKNWKPIKSVNKLKIISCDLEFNISDLSELKELEELHMIFTLDDYKDIESFINSLDNLKKLFISTDLMQTNDAKEYFNNLKSKGIKIETIGPVI